MAYTIPYMRNLAALLLFVAAGLAGTGCSPIARTPDSSATGHAGASDVRVPSGSFTIAPAPDWIRPIQAPDKGTPAPMHFRLLDTQHRVDSEGNIENYYRVVVGGTDIAALLREGQQAIQFDPRYQKVAVHTIVILRDGERIDVTDSVRPRFLSDDRAQSTVFFGKVNALIQIPGFRAGDHLEFAWTISGTNPIYGNSAWTLEDWSRRIPVWKRHAFFLWPESTPIKLDLVSHTAPEDSRLKRIKRTDTVRSGWVSAEFTDTNLPALTFQTQAASGTLETDVLTMSGFQDWNAISAWGEKLFDTAEKPKSDEYQRLVEEFRKLPSPAEQIAAALQWVQREIRYVSLSLGENSHRPYPPDEVLARRYGDCKDTTLLLVNLLRSLGIESRPALMNTSNTRAVRRIDSVPWFNHAITVAWHGGQVYALDGTARGQKSRLEHIAAQHGGADVFVVGGDAPGFLRVPFASPIDDRTLHNEQHMVIDPDTQEGKLTSLLFLRGSAAERKRNEVTSKEHSELKRNMLFETQRHYLNALWAEGPELKDDVENNEISIRAVFRIPQPLKRSGKTWRNEYANADITARLPKVGSAKRKIPVGLDFGIQRVIHTYTLDVPATYRIEEEIHEETIDSSAFTATIQRLRPSATRLVDKQELTLIKDTVEQADIPAYQKAVQELTDFRPEIRLAKPR